MSFSILSKWWSYIHIVNFLATVHFKIHEYNKVLMYECMLYQIRHWTSQFKIVVEYHIWVHDYNWEGNFDKFEQCWHCLSMIRQHKCHDIYVCNCQFYNFSIYFYLISKESDKIILETSFSAFLAWTNLGHIRWCQNNAFSNKL